MICGQEEFIKFNEALFDYLIDNGLYTASEINNWYNSFKAQNPDMSKEKLEILDKSVSVGYNLFERLGYVKNKQDISKALIDMVDEVDASDNLTDSQKDEMADLLSRKSKDVLLKYEEQSRAIARNRRRGRDSKSSNADKAEFMFNGGLSREQAKTLIDKEKVLRDSEKVEQKKVVDEVYDRLEEQKAEAEANSEIINEALSKIRKELGDVVKGKKYKSVLKNLFSSLSPQGVYDSIADIDLFYKVDNLAKMQEIGEAVFDSLAITGEDGKVLDASRVEEFINNIDSRSRSQNDSRRHGYKKMTFIMQGLLIDHYNNSNQPKKASDWLLNFADEANSMGKALASIRQVYQHIFNRVPNALKLEMFKREIKEMQASSEKRKEELSESIKGNETAVAEMEKVVAETAIKKIGRKISRIVKKACDKLKFK